MLKGINDADRNFSLVADFLAQIQPVVAYLSIPTRPPAEKWAQPPDGDAINRAYQILKEKVKNVEYLTGYEGNDFASTGNVEENILSITAVHPMRDDALSIFLKQAGADWTVIRRMVMHDQLTETNYKEHTFYLRKFAEPQREEI